MAGVLIQCRKNITVQPAVLTEASAVRSLGSRTCVFVSVWKREREGELENKSKHSMSDAPSTSHAITLQLCVE